MRLIDSARHLTGSDGLVAVHTGRRAGGDDHRVGPVGATIAELTVAVEAHVDAQLAELTSHPVRYVRDAVSVWRAPSNVDRTTESARRLEQHDIAAAPGRQPRRFHARRATADDQYPTAPRGHCRQRKI